MNDTPLSADRVARVEQLLEESHGLLDEAVNDFVINDNRKLAGIVVLFSGGNDSTTLAHIFRNVATHAAHANTGIGIEQTRQFVRDTCEAWGLPLLEKHTEDGASYGDIVLGRVIAKSGANKGRPIWQGKGFPGPAAHWFMYQRLKERALEKVRNDLVKNPRHERVVFLAGRRMTESKRRENLYAAKPAVERKGSTVWCSALVNWTAFDMNTYRAMNPGMPHNEVTDLLHMSGECLCGAFAHREELEEIGAWFPELAEEIHELEREALALGTIPAERCRWGWGADKEKPSKVGELCNSCDLKFQRSDTEMAA